MSEELPGYDNWKQTNPDDEYIDERPEGCECNKRIGDYLWCPIHGKDPDDALDEQRERQWDNFR